MPIQMITPASPAEAKREIRSFERQYGMSSADFRAHQAIDTIVSEFDAMEWNSLLDLCHSCEIDECSPAAFFPGSMVTKTDTVIDVPIWDLAA
jgi:hypothetical protein